jgi:aspartate carbamoyltransferase catalytic subunit
LLGIEQLAKSDIEALLDLGATYAKQNRSAHKKTTLLDGKSVVNLFFENSTRTRTSFEIAAKRLGADVINVQLANSSTKKGETLLDTVMTIDVMQTDAIVIRHAEDNVPHMLSEHTQSKIINAGDGKHEHPTQALLDALTMIRHKGKIEGLTVAICGDVAHSRVARSNALLLSKLWAKVNMVAPSYFSAGDFKGMNVECIDNLAKGLKDADVVMALRIQRERLSSDEANVPDDDYVKNFRIDHERIKLAKPDVIVMHPGPTNRGIEMTDELCDDPKLSVIREQVEMGVAVRMAVLHMLLAAA